MFIEVSKKVFFETVGQIDVHPWPVGNWDEEKGGYKSLWKLRNGKLVGITQGGVYRVDKALVGIE